MIIKTYILAFLALTLNAQGLPDVISTSSEMEESSTIESVVQESDQDLLDTEESFSYTQIKLDNIKLNQLVAKVKDPVDLTSVSLDKEARRHYIKQLEERFQEYRMDKIDWQAKFENIKGRYINADSEELIAGTKGDALYIDNSAEHIGDITEAANPLSVVLLDTSNNPIATYNYSDDTFTSGDGALIYTNLERDYVYTEGVYVNREGDVLTVADSNLYLNGKRIFKVESRNVRPQSTGAFEGEWIDPEGKKKPFIFQEGKLQTNDSIWFLLL